MDMNDWVMLVTALGGIEGIKQLIKWWILLLKTRIELPMLLVSV